VFENRVLRRLPGPKRDEVMGGWRKPHNEELYNFYSTPSIIRIFRSTRMRWTGDVARVSRTRNAYRILVGKPEGKRPLGRPRYRWVDNIKMDLRWDGVIWPGSIWLRDQWRALVNTVINLQVPYNAGNFLSSCKTGGFPRRAYVHEGS
jgi:hypothetical protein